MQPLALALSWVSLTADGLADATGASSALSSDLVNAGSWMYGAGRDMLHAAQAELAGPVLPQAPAGLADLAANVEAAARQLHRACEPAGPVARAMQVPANRNATVAALASAIGAMRACADELAPRGVPLAEMDAIGGAAWSLGMAHSSVEEAAGDTAGRAAMVDHGNDWLHERIRYLPDVVQVLQNELAALGPVALEAATSAPELPTGRAFKGRVGTMPPGMARRPAGPVTGPVTQASSRMSR